jgi:XTP/dITP diphosphohydrolase
MVSQACILLATTNKGKLREVQQIFAGLPMQLTALDDHAGIPQPVEDADTFEGNAKLKALHYAGLANCWTLADDSGLVVDALDGRPGVHSSRYAGPACDSAANNKKLVAELATVPLQERTARFYCAVTLARPNEVLATASGVVEGLIVDDPRGSNGFGYDPHFLVPEYGITTAEMSPEQKNRISHRGRAVTAILPEITRLLREIQPAG